MPAGETYVRLNVRNNDFKTVMAAIGEWAANATSCGSVLAQPRTCMSSALCPALTCLLFTACRQPPCWAPRQARISAMRCLTVPSAELLLLLLPALRCCGAALRSATATGYRCGVLFCSKPLLLPYRLFRSMYYVYLPLLPPLSRLNPVFKGPGLHQPVALSPVLIKMSLQHVWLTVHLIPRPARVADNYVTHVSHPKLCSAGGRGCQPSLSCGSRPGRGSPPPESC